MSTQAPTFTQPLQSVVALEGSAATFEAQVSGKNVTDLPFHCSNVELCFFYNVYNMKLVKGMFSFYLHNSTVCLQALMDLSE